MPGRTYSLVLDPVKLGVQILGSNLAVSGQVVLNLANLQNTGLLESPRSQLLGEVTVHGGGLLATRCLDGGREPLVLESLNRAKNGEACRVAGLHGRDQVDLRASGLDILSCRHLLLGVVRIGGRGGLQNRREEGAVTTQDLGSRTGHGKNTLAIEECLQIGTQGTGALEKEDVVLLGGRDSVVVEVVGDNGGTVVREMNIDFKEEGADSAGGRGFAGQGEDNVTVLVQEVEDVLRSQGGAESCAI